MAPFGRATPFKYSLKGRRELVAQGKSGFAVWHKSHDKPFDGNSVGKVRCVVPVDTFRVCLHAISPVLVGTHRMTEWAGANNPGPKGFRV